MVIKVIRNDNKGMSLVEIILVVAILSTMIGVVSYGLSLSGGKSVDECAQKITSAIQHARTNTMGKNKTTITITQDASKGVVATESIWTLAEDRSGLTQTDNVRVVGKKGLSIKYSVSGAGDVELTSGSSLTLEFDRGSGELITTNGSNSALCTSITVSKGGKSKTIEIIPITGKVSILN